MNDNILGVIGVVGICFIIMFAGVSGEQHYKSVVRDQLIKEGLAHYEINSTNGESRIVTSVLKDLFEKK